MMNSTKRLFLLLLFVVLSPLYAQEGGKFSLLVTPGVNLPVGTPTEMFTFGGGAELSGIYSMPFAPWLTAKGAVDYSIVPTSLDGSTASMNLLTFSAGTGPVLEFTDWLSMYAYISGGYGLGIYKGELGGSAYFSGEAGVSFLLTPAFGIGAGGGYRHYFSSPTPFYQSVNIHIGAFIRFGQGERKPQIEIFDIRFDPVFPVFYKHYDDNTLGTITLKNSENGPIEDVKVVSSVIIGAPHNDCGGSDAGRAYIYYGGASMDSIDDVTMNYWVAGDELGYSVASAGDVNGDGYSDVIVGGPYNDAEGSNAGCVYIYYGGAVMNSVSDVTMTGETTNVFGWSVSSAGDVNGDGYADVIVGTYVLGQAYIYFGGPSMDSTADVTMNGAGGGEWFGWSVATAGDVNGDGYTDVIVGAHYNNAKGSATGRAYVYYGGASMDDDMDVAMTGAAAWDHFGYSVASAGDVNDDGFADTIVGAPENDAGGSNAGQAYVYYGGMNVDKIADVAMTGASADDEFGRSVTTAGDVNGDGYTDVIIGGPYNDTAGSMAGQAYVYYGGTAISSVADVTVTGEAEDDRFGWSVD